MNSIKHEHFCVECSKPYLCDFPECMTLTGLQRLCQICSYNYGWAKVRDRASEDWSAL